MEFIKKPPVVVYTDHSAVVSISRQTSLTTSSTDKLNLRLVRASQYLSIFDLSVRHKANKTNIVSNALSRLQGSVSITMNGPEMLKALYEQAVKVTASLVNIAAHKNSPLLEPCASYHITLIEMSDDFKTRLFKEYVKDKQWSKVLRVIKTIEKIDTSDRSKEISLSIHDPVIETEDLPKQSESNVAESEDDLSNSRIDLWFKLRDELLYYTNFNNERKRLYILNSLKKKIFELAHDH